jgi:hypothetical protein
MNILEKFPRTTTGPIEDHVKYIRKVSNYVFGCVKKQAATMRFIGGILTHLDLSSNNLSEEFPNYFIHWQELKILNLAHNNLSREIPLSMGSLTQLIAWN